MFWLWILYAVIRKLDSGIDPMIHVTASIFFPHRREERFAREADSMRMCYFF